MPPPSPLTIHLFGPLRVLIHGEPMPHVRTRTIEWLLALLVLRQGRSVERSWLAGTLWPDSDEERALHNLRDALVHLRKALGPEKERIQSPTRDTLTLDLKDAEVDVVRFDRAIRLEKDEALVEAVEVYTGPLLEGCTEEWVFQERTAHKLACLQALEKLANVAGNTEQALALLRRAQEIDPRRDSTRRALMRVLWANGDAPSALNIYREYRALLRQEMNVEPDQETVQLFQLIRQSPQHDAGHRDATTQEATSSSPTPSLPTSLPHPLTALIGREQEMRDITAALSDSRLVTLVGGGGVGKTRLATEIGGEITSQTGQQVVFVALASLSDSALLPNFVAATLGIREESPDPTLLLQAITTCLASHSVLLVLDNCEHLLDAAAVLIQTLLNRCPDLRVLATSRQCLGLTGEVAWRVPSLSTPKPEGLLREAANTVGTALEYPAIRLFVERATMATSDFLLTDPKNVMAVATICQRLDGIPLAIELASARVAIMNVVQIASRLDDRFRLLTGGSRAALPRQQTLRSLIDWSYDLLSDAEKTLLSRLSVFSGGWTLEAVEVVGESGAAPQTSIETWEILDLLTSLIDKSLVVGERLSKGVRYRLLETIRQYASDRLRESGEAPKTRERHRDYFLTLAEEAEPQLRGPQQQVWLERLEMEHDNLRSALQGNGEAEMRLAASLWRFWMLRGHLSEGRTRYRELLAPHDNALPSPTLARTIHAAGNLAFVQSDLTAARRYFERAANMRNALGDRAGEAATRANLATVSQGEGDFITAREQFERSLVIHKEFGNTAETCVALTCLGNVNRELGEFEVAREYLLEALQLNRDLGDRANEANALNLLGICYTEMGDLVAARSACEQALVINKELGITWETAHNLTNLGRLACFQENWDETASYYAESLRLHAAIGARKETSICFVQLAHVEAVRNLPGRAARLLGAGEACLGGVAIRGKGDQQFAEDLAARLRETFGESEFASEFEKGRALTLEQAIALATQGVNR